MGTHYYLEEGTHYSLGEIMGTHYYVGEVPIIFLWN